MTASGAVVKLECSLVIMYEAVSNSVEHLDHGIPATPQPHDERGRSTSDACKVLTPATKRLCGNQGRVNCSNPDATLLLCSKSSGL